MSLPPLVIISGPSGSGKSTLIRRLVEGGDLPLHVSVSATTRPPRAGERDGVDYHFWTRERFREEIDKGSFLEWAGVHDEYYGTLRREVEPFRQAGQLVILDIDVMGAAQIRGQGWPCVSIFLTTPSLATDEARLKQRGTETAESIERRLARARWELERAGEFDYQVVNDCLDGAVAEVHGILKSHLQGEAHAG